MRLNQYLKKNKSRKKISVLYLAALDPQFLYFKLPSIFQRELHDRSLRQKETECHSIDLLLSECNDLSCPPPLPSFLQGGGGCSLTLLRGKGSVVQAAYPV